MDANSFSFLTTVLTHLKDASVDWAEVAKERGISRKDNAATGFKGIMKKHGLDYSNGKFTPIDGFDATAKTPSTPKTKGSSTPRKRKLDDTNKPDRDTKESPTKKSKSTKAMTNLKEKTVAEADVKEAN